jgi:hypothetical protein
MVDDVERISMDLLDISISSLGENDYSNVFPG